MAQNRGEQFEDDFKSSIPEGILVRKLSTAGPRAQSLGGVMGLLDRLAAKAGEEVPGWAKHLLTSATHTPRQPYDMLVAPPVMGPDGREAVEAGADFRTLSGAAYRLEGRPAVVFALEFKSAGAQQSIPFDRLQPHQEAGLLKEAQRGHFAGVVVEFPDHEPAGCYFVPIASWRAAKEQLPRKSLPLDVARVIGKMIRVDEGRGRTRRYFRVTEFLRDFGADC